MAAVGRGLKRAAKAIFGNFWWKLLSLAIAVSLWFYASSQQQKEKYLTVPLIVEKPEGFALLSQSTERVSFTVRGPGALVSRLEERSNGLEMVCTLDAETLQGKDTNSLDINPRWLRLPEAEFLQLRFDQIDPATVNVRTCPYTTRLLAVKPRLLGQPREGYEVNWAQTRVIPSEVSVKAPARVLDEISFLRTQGIAVYDRDFADRVPLVDTYDVRLENGERVKWKLELGAEAVRVHIKLTPRPSTRTFTLDEVYLLMPPDFRYEAQLSPDERVVQVTVTGLPQELDALTEESLLAYVYLGKLAGERVEPGGSANYKQDVKLMPLPGVSPESVRVEPPRITVILKNKAE